MRLGAKIFTDLPPQIKFPSALMAFFTAAILAAKLGLGPLQPNNNTVLTRLENLSGTKQIEKNVLVDPNTGIEIVLGQDEAINVAPQLTSDRKFLVAREHSSSGNLLPYILQLDQDRIVRFDLPYYSEYVNNKVFHVGDNTFVHAVNEDEMYFYTLIFETGKVLTQAVPKTSDEIIYRQLLGAAEGMTLIWEETTGVAADGNLVVINCDGELLEMPADADLRGLLFGGFEGRTEAARLISPIVASNGQTSLIIHSNSQLYRWDSQNNQLELLAEDCGVELLTDNKALIRSLTVDPITTLLDYKFELLDLITGQTASTYVKTADEPVVFLGQLSPSTVLFLATGQPIVDSPERIARLLVMDLSTPQGKVAWEQKIDIDENTGFVEIRN